MNTELRNDIVIAPDWKAKQVIKETADFVGIVVDMIPTGKIGWLYFITNYKTIIEIVKLVIKLVNRIKEITNDRSNPN